VATHRLPSDIHRHPACGGLSPIATETLIGVIYIMNAKQMKSHPTSSQKGSGLVTRFQWFMAVIGIVTAIACSLVLLKEIQPAQNEVKQSYRISAQGSLATKQITSVKTLSVFSILAKF